MVLPTLGPHATTTNKEREFDPIGSWGGLYEDWGSDPAIIARNEHRHLLQLGYVDRFIGQLLDRLQQNDLLDKSPLIVTADHGVSFRAESFAPPAGFGELSPIS